MDSPFGNAILKPFKVCETAAVLSSELPKWHRNGIWFSPLTCIILLIKHQRQGQKNGTALLSFWFVFSFSFFLNCYDFKVFSSGLFQVIKRNSVPSCEMVVWRNGNWSWNLSQQNTLYDHLLSFFSLNFSSSIFQVWPFFFSCLFSTQTSLFIWNVALRDTAAMQ